MRKAKAVLRRRLLDARRAIGAEEHARFSRRIADRLYGLEPYRRAAVVHLFIGAIDGEVATREIAERSLASGKRVLCPRVVWRERRIESYEIGSPADLAPARLGLWEPDPTRSRLASESEIDLVLVPGIAFDPQGRRIGYGAGFYDRFLARVQSSKIALAFSLQVVPEVPTTEHDVPVDWIVTEAEAIDCRSARPRPTRDAM
ncbi:MAG TPA: 5-formyltetrahydrofolate cyclo-ligase [Gemmatimonadota bacterium]|nr:5-formyltetrahydrofolate cyclo-ligase [Gemmatimonadota bacterium]